MWKVYIYEQSHGHLSSYLENWTVVELWGQVFSYIFHNYHLWSCRIALQPWLHHPAIKKHLRRHKIWWNNSLWYTENNITSDGNKTCGQLKDSLIFTFSQISYVHFNRHLIYTTYRYFISKPGKNRHQDPPKLTTSDVHCKNNR